MADEQGKSPPEGAKVAAPAAAKPTPPNEGSVATQAPAVHTDNPFRVKRKQLEEQLKQQDQDRSRHAAYSRATTQAMLAELKDSEARYGQSGFSPITPRGNLLYAGAIQAQYPDDHLRWVNETMPGRAEFLTSMGYERVPEGKRGGDLVLWKIPRQKWAEGVVAKDAQTEKNLRRATTQSRQDTVAELQEHFDRHGVNVDVEKLVPREV